MKQFSLNFLFSWILILIYNNSILDLQFYLNNYNIALLFFTHWLSPLIINNYKLHLLQWNITLVLLSQDLFIFLLFIEIMLLLFISLYNSNKRIKIHALNRLLFYTLFSSLGLILLLLIDYIILGTSSNDLLSLTPINPIFYNFLLITLIVKIPIFPLHVWLSYAHAEASTELSIFLAAIIIKLPFYGIFSFLKSRLELSYNNDYILISNNIWSTLGILSLIYCTLLSIQSLLDIKRIIAYSSIIHMSIPFLIILEHNCSISSIQLLILTHGFTSTILFYLLGKYTHKYSKNILYYSGISNYYPIYSLFIIISVLSNISIPFPIYLSFLSEYLNLLNIYYIYNLNILLLIIITLSISAIYFLIYFIRFLFGNIGVLTPSSSPLNLYEYLISLILILTLFLFPFILESLEAIWN